MQVLVPTVFRSFRGLSNYALACHSYSGLLGHDTMYSVRWVPMFQRTRFPQVSGWELVPNHQTTQCHKQESPNTNLHHCKHFKSCILNYFCLPPLLFLYSLISVHSASRAPSVLLSSLVVAETDLSTLLLLFEVRMGAHPQPQHQGSTFCILEENNFWMG